MKLSIHTSNTKDGDMRTYPNDHDASFGNRQKFLQSKGLAAESTILLRVLYEGKDFKRYKTVDASKAGDGLLRSSTITTDGLFTNTPNLTLFLPLADCTPLVLFHEQSHSLMLSHLGRHSIEQDGTKESVKYFLKRSNADPEDVIAWVGPGAGKENYPLFKLNNQAMKDVILQHLISTGINKDNIKVSDIDTTKDPNYYSHSNYLKGLQDTDARFAVAVTIEKDGYSTF